jgi:hypothetical protein
MSCVVISTYRRPNTSVSWHTNVFSKINPAFVAEANKVKLAERRKITQLDELTLEIEVTWDSKEAYEEFMTIEAVKNHFNLLDFYNQNAGITQDPKRFIES